MQNEYEFDLLRGKHPYSQDIKFDLEEQLKGRNLGKTIPKRVKEFLFSIPEVKSMLRDDKLKELLKND